MHMLELRNVNSGYNKKTVLHNINLTIDEPSIYVVLGPNGAGKTTLFRTIAGILEPYSGEVLFDSENVTISRDVRKRINYLSHYNALPEEMTVYNALMFPRTCRGETLMRCSSSCIFKNSWIRKSLTYRRGRRNRSQSRRCSSGSEIST